MTKQDIVDEAISEKKPGDTALDLKAEIEKWLKLWSFNFSKCMFDESPAKENFYRTVKSDCLKEYNYYLYNNCSFKELNWNLIGIHFVLYEQLGSLHYLLSDRQEHLTKTKMLILSISCCLNMKNSSLLDFVSPKSAQNHLNTKRSVLKEFLKKEIKGITVLQLF